MEKILDVGCGINKISNSIGIDICKLEGVDIMMDLSISDLPFRDCCFDKIYCNHIFEHFRVERRLELMKEFFRVLRNGGYLIIEVPHRFSLNVSKDPTHKDVDKLVLDMFDYFTINSKFDYYFDFKFEIISKKIVNVSVDVPFIGRLFNKLILKISNRWENILSFIPCSAIHMKFVLSKK
jgi:ubiquinone/menaquinone biosynthesis C-methylase UbiE